MDPFFKYSGIILWIGIALYLLLRIFFGKNWPLKIGLRLFAGKDLVKSSKQLIKEVNEKQIKQETLTEVGVHVFWRFTRLGLFALLIAGIPIWLLWRQNTLIENQNKLFLSQNSLFQAQNIKIDSQTVLLSAQTQLFQNQNEKLDTQNVLFQYQNENVATQTDLFRDQNLLVQFQNTRIDSQINLMGVQNDRLNLQNNLIEADRRSSLVFLMGNILDKVDEEIKEQRDSLKLLPGFDPDSVKYRLSKPLISRIVALSRSFKPYRVMEGDTLSADLVSPERGQLFIALMENQLDSVSQNTIVESGDFSYAVIGEVDLRSANLSFANLRSADLSSAYLRYAKLIEANLRDAILSDVRVSKVNWFENLKVEKVIGAEEITRKYRVNPKIHKDDYGNEFYLIEEIP